MLDIFPSPAKINLLEKTIRNSQNSQRNDGSFHHDIVEYNSRKL